MLGSEVITGARRSSDGKGSGQVIKIPLDELDQPLLGARLRTRYQPIVRLSDRQPIGLEVLARLDHPAHGTVTPEHFVPQMESTGRSRQLTEAVTARAFKEFASHLAPLGLTMALNFPLDVLMDPQMLDWLEQCRRAAAIEADRLVIELTESLPVAALGEGQFQVMAAAVAELRATGYGIAIDDVSPEMARHRDLFGLDFTIMKLDKGVVGESAGNPEAERFLAGTIAAAHGSAMVVVAEGVKDRETWNRMRALGVDQAQGFMVARPLPAAAVSVWLDSWQTAASP